MEKFFHQNTPETPDGRLEIVQAMILEILMDKEFEVLLDVRHRRQFRFEIRNALNNYFTPLTSEYVKDVYFSEFLVQ